VKHRVDLNSGSCRLMVEGSITDRSVRHRFRIWWSVRRALEMCFYMVSGEIMMISPLWRMPYRVRRKGTRRQE
jgi:hypothetical protein